MRRFGLQGHLLRYGTTSLSPPVPFPWQVFPAQLDTSGEVTLDYATGESYEMFWT
jgi:hypothetical protein